MKGMVLKVLHFSLRLGLVLGCFLYVVWGMDFSRFFGVIQHYQVWALVAVLLFSFLSYGVMACRLVFLGAGRMTWRQAFLANMLCLGMNNIFPARLGEVAKLSYFRKQTNVSWQAGLGILFWERFFDLNMLLGLALVTSARQGHNLVLFPLAAVVAAIWLGLLVLRRSPQLVSRLMRCLPEGRFQLLLSDACEHLKRGLTLRFIVPCTLWTLLLWTLFVLFYFLALCWVGGLALTPTQLVDVFVVMALGYNLPTTPGGLGVFEASAVLALGWFGMNKEEALAIALLIRGMQYVPTLPAALAILAFTGLSPKALSAEQEALSHPQAETLPPAKAAP